MRRKLPALLAVLAVAGPAGVVASGCGDEAPGGVDVAQAATQTKAKGTARFALDVRASGLGLPGALRFEGEGVTSLDRPAMDFSADIGKTLSSIGLPVGDAQIRLKLADGQLYVQPKGVRGLDIPNGKSWVGLDIAQLADALGLDGKGLTSGFSVDPAGQLQALTKAKGLKEAGEEDVAGATTTHFTGTLKLRDLIAALPADQREQAQKALDQLAKQGAGTGFSADTAIPTELWVDDQGVLRRMRQTLKTPSAQGVPAGEFRVQYELSDFGAKLDTSPPPASDRYDATDDLNDLLKSGAAGLLGP
ncbi:hypothetical protein [Conexibacter sp. SYSU D00693]|uniref:hypothetical protein n=1 Tax=Conexibacter sp. SYSU D00693 TaxID=2812560 RepID=UPI00196AEA5F|nr:hypothetical protein [Conexibacter sp. SYSU D00693]